MTTITVTNVEKDYAGSGTVRITGTYADATFYQPSQSITVENYPTGNYSFMRGIRLTDAAVFCFRNGSSPVAMYAASWASIAAGLEESLASPPAFTLDPADDDATYHTGANTAPAVFTATVVSEQPYILTWYESSDGTTYGASPLTTTGIYDVGTPASGTLTSDNTNVSNGDVVNIGGKTYVFKTALTASPGVEGEVLIGVDADASLTNLADAINRDTPSSKNGVKYWAAAAHPLVSSGAVVAHAITVTARGGGTSGNSIPTYEYAAHLSWGATTLGSGAAGDGGDGGLEVSPIGDTQDGYYYKCVAVNLSGSTDSDAAQIGVTDSGA